MIPSFVGTSKLPQAMATSGDIDGLSFSIDRRLLRGVDIIECRTPAPAGLAASALMLAPSDIRG